MTDADKTHPAMTREERLAAQLRANLRRRKQQARALGQAPTGSGPDAVNAPLAKPRGDG